MSNKNHLTTKNILVIGGAGYIGSVLTRKLLHKGYRVRVLDNLIYNNGSTLYNLLENENFSFIHGDFGNKKILSQALKDTSTVILLAALVGDPICKKYPELALKTNLVYPKNLIQRMAGENIEKFIFTSTCSNYGLRKDDTPAKEESELNPLSLYAECKVNFEKFLLENREDLSFSPTILRLSTAFGMSLRMRFDLTISEFTRELALGNKLIVYDEKTWRPYCNVSDISDAVLKVIQAPSEIVSGQVFNVGSDENNYTKQMIVNLIQKYVRNTRIEYKSMGTDPRNYRVSFAKVKKILNFETRYPADYSVKNLVAAVNNNLFRNIEARKNFYGNYEINLKESHQPVKA